MRLEFSAGAVVYKEDEEGKPLFLLLMKENKEYDIPKGHIEKGESSAEAARREIREETGLEVDFTPGFSEVTKYFFRRKKTRVIKTNRIFLAKVKDPEVRVSEEHIGYDWLGYEELQKRIRYKNTRQLFATAMDYIRRMGEMDALNGEYSMLPSSQTGWDLSRRLVPGEGPLNATVMCIGQAPGRFEDEKLRPFIGRSGMLLTDALSKARLRRERIYITSVVQFFPPGNRMPTEKEIDACMPFLRRQMEIVKPEFVIALGSLASKMLVGTESVEKDHGNVAKEGETTYMVTFHPAAALRFKRVHLLFIEDMKKFGRAVRESQGRR